MKSYTMITLQLSALTALSNLGAHEHHDSNGDDLANSGYVNHVRITESESYRIIEANGWPDHSPGRFPRRGNPNTASPQSYTFRVPLEPTMSTHPVPSRGWFGVAINGVPFEPGTAETWNNDRRSSWRYEANTGYLNLGLDWSHAHVQPTGAYHYHALPNGLVERLGGDGHGMLLIGWAADGYPIYSGYGYSDPMDMSSSVTKVQSSYRLKVGVRPDGPGGGYDGRFTEDFEYVPGWGDLDEYNGRFGSTSEYPGGVYHYYITDAFPFISRHHRGTPDPSFSKRFGPRGRQGNERGPRPGHRPPPPQDHPWQPGR